MFSIFQTEQRYPNTWNDDIVVAVYENDACKEYDRAISFYANASKKIILRKITYVHNLSVDMLLILENIIHLTNIEAFAQDRKLMLYSENSTITVQASKQLLEILTNLS